MSSGLVKLVAVTSGVGDLAGKTGEEIVAYVARVSNPTNQNKHETASNIIKYCLKNGHYSIFETVSLTVEIKTSRAIAAQILRHRSFTFQEFCVAGTTVVETDKGGFLIKDLFKTKVPFRVRVLDLDSGVFSFTSVKEVFSTGKKETYTILFEDGRNITCTRDHKFLTRDKQFVALEKALHLQYDDLNINVIDFDRSVAFAIDGAVSPEFIRVVLVTHSGTQDTYDLETEHGSHNYVANGIVTHNSQRYAKPKASVLYPARRQDTKNRQNSVDDLSDETKEWFTEQQTKVWEDAKLAYDGAIERGIAKECARFLLPIATETTMYMTSNLRNFIFYCNQRAGNGTQQEHMDIALGVKAILIEQFPSVAIALDWK